jgi:hypothetical protein
LKLPFDGPLAATSSTSSFLSTSLYALAMTERTRAVIIDDRDSRIQFTGNWVAATGEAYNNQGSYGPVYRNTLQGSTANGAKLTFSFNGEFSSFAVSLLRSLTDFRIGTGAEILGTFDPEFEDGSTDPDPNWDCILDGGVNSDAKGASSPPGGGSINQWPFCRFSSLIPGQHTIELVVRTKGNAFWFDEIKYVPTDVVSGETIEVGQEDQDIRYGSYWQSYREVAYTQTGGSRVTISFSGERCAFLSWYYNYSPTLILEGTGITLLSNYHTDFPSGPSEAGYIIDDREPVFFTIPGGGSRDDYNRRLLEVPGLPAGNHILVVQYRGSVETIPLMVDRFLIEGGTNLRAGLASSGGSSGEVASPTPTQSSGSTVIHEPLETSNGGSATSSEGNNSRPDSANAPTAAIAIGVALGVLALVFLVLFLFWIRRRRNIRDRLSSQPADSNAPFLDHGANGQLARPRYTPPTPSMSTLSGSVLSYVAAPNSEAGSKLLVLAPQSATAMRSSRGPESTFSDPPLDYTQSTVPPPLTSDHQASRSISTSFGTNATVAVLQHEDSGMRFSNRKQMQTVEVPPMYSAQ